MDPGQTAPTFQQALKLTCVVIGVLLRVRFDHCYVAWVC